MRSRRSRRSCPRGTRSAPKLQCFRRRSLDPRACSLTGPSTPGTCRSRKPRTRSHRSRRRSPRGIRAAPTRRCRSRKSPRPRACSSTCLLRPGTSRARTRRTRSRRSRRTSPRGTRSAPKLQCFRRRSLDSRACSSIGRPGPGMFRSRNPRTRSRRSRCTCPHRTPPAPRRRFRSRRTRRPRACSPTYWCSFPQQTVASRRTQSADARAARSAKTTLLAIASLHRPVGEGCRRSAERAMWGRGRAGWATWRSADEGVGGRRDRVPTSGRRGARAGTEAGVGQVLEAERRGLDDASRPRRGALKRRGGSPTARFLSPQKFVFGVDGAGG